MKFPNLKKCLSYFKFTNIMETLRGDNAIKMSAILQPPKEVYGIKEVNKDLFRKEITVPCLLIKEAKLSTIMPIVKKYLLKLEKWKPVQTIGNETVIYLKPLINNWEDLEQNDRENLKKLLTSPKIEKKLLLLQYDNYSLESVFRAILPENAEGFSSFTRIGHIVHVNLRDHLLPYKNVIGQVLFDKVANCRTVVNKVDTINSTFRNFQIEILKGDNDMITCVNENKCRFQFDFSQVYWNSRLCTEHERITDRLKSGDVLFDMFAGVGPFAIPAAKKKCHVLANDLNPESFKWLNHNAKLNKINETYLKTVNKDGKDFILEDFKENFPKFMNGTNQIYVVMNLPAIAVEFLQHFIGLFDETELSDFKTTPIVFVYCFTKGEDCVSLAENLFYKHIGTSIKITDIFKVRTVSSLKEMMRITFRLERDLLIGNLSRNKRKIEENEQEHLKKCNYGQKQENQQCL